MALNDTHQQLLIVTGNDVAVERMYEVYTQVTETKCRYFLWVYDDFPFKDRFPISSEDRMEISEKLRGVVYNARPRSVPSAEFGHFEPRNFGSEDGERRWLRIRDEMSLAGWQLRYHLGCYENPIPRSVEDPLLWEAMLAFQPFTHLACIGESAKVDYFKRRGTELGLSVTVAPAVAISNDDKDPPGFEHDRLLIITGDGVAHARLLEVYDNIKKVTRFFSIVHDDMPFDEQGWYDYKPDPRVTDDIVGVRRVPPVVRNPGIDLATGEYNMSWPGYDDDERYWRDIRQEMGIDGYRLIYAWGETRGEIPKPVEHPLLWEAMLGFQKYTHLACIGSSAKVDYFRKRGLEMGLKVVEAPAVA